MFFLTFSEYEHASVTSSVDSMLEPYRDTSAVIEKPKSSITERQLQDKDNNNNDIKTTISLSTIASTSQKFDEKIPPHLMDSDKLQTNSLDKYYQQYLDNANNKSTSFASEQVISSNESVGLMIQSYVKKKRWWTSYFIKINSHFLNYFE